MTHREQHRQPGLSGCAGHHRARNQDPAGVQFNSGGRPAARQHTGGCSISVGQQIGAGQRASGRVQEDERTLKCVQQHRQKILDASAGPLARVCRPQYRVGHHRPRIREKITKIHAELPRVGYSEHHQSEAIGKQREIRILRRSAVYREHPAAGRRRASKESVESPLPDVDSIENHQN
ncbi:hypothetical protein [Rhodococcus erythropolis]|uniref:hypothetical protein n=1 Tax=Rhodococcus erythropolis TaxID=1833 RepID=UPI0020926E75|nr:hypothetical protein [Rhodococcus erythropolis]